VGLHSVRVSVGRTWRFVADGRTCADVDATAYRRQIDELKSPAAQGFVLPWPTYRSHVWRYMYSADYRNTRSAVQVSTLMPTLWTDRLTVTNALTPTPWNVEIEVFRHPFALTTLVHVNPASGGDWPADAAAASTLLRAVLRTPLAGTNAVVDGFPASEVPSLPTRSFEGGSLTLEDAGQVVVLSALHDEPDGRGSASALARRFDDEPDPEDAVPMRTTRGAVSVRGETVALVLPAALPRAERRLECLHHNTTVVLAYLQNLATLLGPSTTTTCEWYREPAATVLNHLHRRTPLAETGSVYKSRLPELWLDERRLGAAINALAPGLPALPT
jgi:hypothetical protein